MTKSVNCEFMSIDTILIGAYMRITYGNIDTIR